MRELVLNDGRKTEIQKVEQREGEIRIRLILQTSDQLKALFKDEFATSKMIERQNGVDVVEYENYTELSYIKEELGGIWEVALVQQGAGVEQRLQTVEEITLQMQKDLENAIVELTMAMAETKEDSENV